MARFHSSEFMGLPHAQTQRESTKELKKKMTYHQQKNLPLSKGTNITTHTHTHTHTPIGANGPKESNIITLDIEMH